MDSKPTKEEYLVDYNKGDSSMRIQIYSQELTKEVALVHKTADTGIEYYGVRFFLASPDILHHTPEDDDRSAVTFWIPNAMSFTREDLAQLLYKAAHLVESAPDPEPSKEELAQPLYKKCPVKGCEGVPVLEEKGRWWQCSSGKAHFLWTVHKETPRL